MIKIKSQDSTHQYDENKNPITTWDEKKCSWIVNSEYDTECIDWWGVDNDFPAGYTLKEYERQNPNWDKMPDISVTWTWDMEGYEKAFNEIPVDNLSLVCTRTWGYLDFSKEEAIESLGHYLDFNRYANTKIVYNGETIFDGKLK